MSHPNDGMKYYMPLTQGLPKDGPTTSVFSIPKFKYSPETEVVVKNLMRESRLTFTQKNVFNTILRDGKSLPDHPNQMNLRLNQAYMQQRHRNKARGMGIQLLDLEESYKPAKMLLNQIQRGRGPQGRRSLEAIKASGALEPIELPRCYIPVSNDVEKDRLAHKMAFGKDLDNSLTASNKNMADKEKTQDMKSKTVNDLKQERFEELIDEIQDRMQFILTMDEMKKGKEYRGCIINQINEKLQEMKHISPEQEKNVRDCLQLELLDPRMGSSFAEEHHKLSNFFE